MIFTGMVKEIYPACLLGRDNLWRMENEDWMKTDFVMEY